MSIIKHVTLQKIIARDFRYDPRIRWAEAQFHLFFTLALDGGDLTTLPLYPRERSTNRRLGRPHRRSGRFCGKKKRTKNLLPLAGFERRTSQPVTSYSRVLSGKEVKKDMQGKNRENSKRKEAGTIKYLRQVTISQHSYNHSLLLICTAVYSSLSKILSPPAFKWFPSPPRAPFTAPSAVFPPPLRLLKPPHNRLRNLAQQRRLAACDLNHMVISTILQRHLRHISNKANVTFILIRCNPRWHQVNAYHAWHLVIIREI